MGYAQHIKRLLFGARKRRFTFDFDVLLRAEIAASGVAPEVDMSRFFFALPAILACSVSHASPVYEFTPQPRSSVAPIAYAGDPVTVLGIEPRMPVADVEKILAREFDGGNISRSTNSFGGRFNGETVQIAPFTSAIIATKRIEKGYSEDLRVYFSSPASGQRVVSVQRTLVYEEGGSAPAFSAATAGIVGKYGAQPNPSIVPGGRQVGYANVTKNGKKTFCRSPGADGCNYINAYQAELASQYLALKDRQNGLVLTADLTRGVFSENKLGYMSIKMYDFDFAIQAAQADLEALQEASTKKMAEPNKIAMPKL